MCFYKIDYGTRVSKDFQFGESGSQNRKHKALWSLFVKGLCRKSTGMIVAYFPLKNYITGNITQWESMQQTFGILPWL